MAWFPAPYLEKLEEDGDEDDTDGTRERGSCSDAALFFLTRVHLQLMSTSATSGTLYLTAKNYKASKGDEISVAVGAVVEVLQKSDSGWWLIR